MNQNLSHFLQLGLAIAIMSSSGTLGRYIELPPPVTIWLRCLLGAGALYAVLKIWKIDFRIWKGNFWLLFASSAFLGLHWVTYFYALQLSSVAVGMLSLFTYPVITALLEPVMLKTHLKPGVLVLAIIAFVGVAFLVPELTLDNGYTMGIIFGILSAIFYSVRNIMLKKRIAEHSGIALMFYQLLIVTILLWPVLFIYDFQWVPGVFGHWKALLVLGLFTTAAGHTLFVLSFRHFTISTVSIISSITPLLGSFLGFIFLDEVPAGRTIIGGLLIFLTVIVESIRSAREKRGLG